MSSVGLPPLQTVTPAASWEAVWRRGWECKAPPTPTGRLPVPRPSRRRRARLVATWKALLWPRPSSLSLAPPTKRPRPWRRCCALIGSHLAVLQVSRPERSRAAARKLAVFNPDKARPGPHARPGVPPPSSASSCLRLWFCWPACGCSWSRRVNVPSGCRVPSTWLSDTSTDPHPPEDPPTPAQTAT